MRTLLIGIALSTCAGFFATVEPGHHALRFEPNNGGVRPQVLGPGRYHIGPYDRLEDFDITYSTSKEVIRTTSVEGLALEINLAVIYRPIAQELYELDTEIGRNYYDEVVGPEFRSAARGVFARHSYTELAKSNEKIEDEIESDLRRRIRGKHVDISSITMERVGYAPEITAADQAKLVGERDAARQKAQIENEALKQQLALKLQADQAKLAAERAADQAKADAARAAEQDKREAERAVRAAQNARAIAEEEGKMARAQAQASIIKARSEAEQRILLAHAAAEEKLPRRRARPGWRCRSTRTTRSASSAARAPTSSSATGRSSRTSCSRAWAPACGAATPPTRRATTPRAMARGPRRPSCCPKSLTTREAHALEPRTEKLGDFISFQR
jgi:hypothetical protein